MADSQTAIQKALGRSSWMLSWRVSIGLNFHSLSDNKIPISLEISLDEFLLITL
jgi:hypothetical protein